MLNQIPLEVLVLISNFLTLQDKLCLITTCRHVFTVISTTNLFSELNLLINHTEQVEEILGRFISNQYSGAQVKKLSFDVKKVPEQLLFRLPAVFPNVSRLKTQIYHTESANSQGGHFTDIALQWKDTLEIYDMRYDWIEILPVLKTTVFPQLTKLVLVGAYAQQDKKDGFDIPYYIPHIKNAPALRMLTLTDCALDLDFLEHIHTSCPLLKSLELVETHIIINSDTTLPPITPADSLLYLKLNNNFIFDTNGLLLDYMTAKYQCLSELDFTCNDEYDSYEFSIHHDVDDGDLFTDSDDDSEDNSDDGSDEEDIRRYTQIYKSLQRDFETTLAVYNESGSKLFSNINPQLKSLAIQGDAFGNTLQTLSSSDIQLVSLTYGDVILNVDQLDYIRQLKYLKTLHITVNIPNNMNVPIIPLSSITSLTITNLGQPTGIQWLFSTFPSLEELDMRESFIWNTPNDINTGSTLIFPNLLNLTADIPFLDQNSFDFLSLIAPNIEVLDLTFKMTTPITIDISNWKLKKVCLDTFDRVLKDCCYYKIDTTYANEILKVDRSNGSVTLVRDRALEFADTEPLMIHITSTIDKRFMFYKYSLSLTQNQITLIPPT